MHVGIVVPNDVDYGLDIANALNEIGVSVTLYLSFTRMAEYLSTSDQVNLITPQKLKEHIFELQLLPAECRVRLFRYPRIRDPRSFKVIHRIKRCMLNDGIDVAHLLIGPGDLWSAVLAHLIRSKPVVSTMIIPKPNIGEDLPVWLLKAISKLLANGSDLVIVNGADQVEYLQETYSIPYVRIAHVPLGPRTTAIKWAKQKSIEERGTVLFFGRAHPHKGLEYLIQAQPIISSQVPHARILIVAHGRDLDRYRQMIQDESKYEIHEGFLPGTEANAYFERASLLALPYLSASTSGVLMTAYVFGKPVVATNVGCLPEYVQDGITGLLVPASNIERLANAIIRLLSDDLQRQRMGENAKRWVNELQKKVAWQTLEAYEKAIYLKES